MIGAPVHRMTLSVSGRASHSLEQSSDAHAQSVGQHFDGVDGWIRSSRLDSGHVRPSEATPISECLQAHAHGHTQLPDSGAELLLKRWGGENRLELAVT